MTRSMSRRIAVLRLGFGMLWAIDAYLKWQPAFLRGFISYVAQAAQGQPAWLTPWFHFWLGFLRLDPHLFAVLAAVFESLTALGLILGVMRRVGYILATLFSLGIWSVAEGFGGPYTAGATDVGAGIVYAVAFAALYGLDRGTSALSLDSLLERRWPRWKAIAEPSEALVLQPNAPADESVPLP